MKTYKTPNLVARGSITELTMGDFPGDTDPDMISNLEAFGSIGFNL